MYNWDKINCRLLYFGWQVTKTADTLAKDGAVIQFLNYRYHYVQVVTVFISDQAGQLLAIGVPYEASVVSQKSK